MQEILGQLGVCVWWEKNNWATYQSALKQEATHVLEY